MKKIDAGTDLRDITAVGYYDAVAVTPPAIPHASRIRFLSDNKILMNNKMHVRDGLGKPWRTFELINYGY